MKPFVGIGRSDRERLSAVLRGTTGTITVGDATGILGMPRNDAAKLLARWAKGGWLLRVKRGLYVPVPLEASTADVRLEDAWVVAVRMFEPCYIGGWSAAEYWELTEQIFRSVLVITTRRPRDRRPKIKGTDLLVRSVYPRALFGLKSVWCGQAKVNVSDPTRTVLDLLSDSAFAGDLQQMTNIFRAWLASEHRNLPLLFEYGDRSGNGAVFKRLGFLLELYAPDESAAIGACLERLTAGNAKLDNTLPCEKLVTRWRLRVPIRWKEEEAMASDHHHLNTSQVLQRLGVSHPELAMLCREYGIVRLSLFGSVTRDDFGPESDVDVRLEFAPDKTPGMYEIVALQDALSQLFGGRSVDMLTNPVIRNPFRRRAIERDTVVAYAA